MKSSNTLLRRLLPALLLVSLALSSCEHRKDRDPRPDKKGKCGSASTPGGNS